MLSVPPFGVGGDWLCDHGTERIVVMFHVHMQVQLQQYTRGTSLEELERED